jgi:hypothetical protein
MATLPNGKPINMDMLETAMEDSDLANRYFLNLVTGEVVFFSDYLGLSDEDEHLLEEIDGSNDYVAVERIPSCIGYLAHPFVKEALWAFIAILFLSVRWDSAIDRGRESFSFTRENTGVWTADNQGRHTIAP